MSNRSRREAEARAEARRRARYQARGVPVDEGDEEALEADERRESPAPAAGGGFLTRLFPPAPPLPNRPDPLRNFSYSGPLRGVVAGLYLLMRNPLPWILAGALWAMGRLFTDNSMVGIVASLVSFGALIGAGWFGWQRPWLYGLAAGVLGWLIFVTTVLAIGASVGPTPSASPSASAPVTASDAGSPSPSPVASPTPAPTPDGAPGAGLGAEDDPALLAQAIAIQTLFQMFLGAAAGWYGGYLRRRLASAPANQRRPPRRR